MEGQSQEHIEDSAKAEEIAHVKQVLNNALLETVTPERKVGNFTMHNYIDVNKLTELLNKELGEDTWDFAQEGEEDLRVDECNFVKIK